MKRSILLALFAALALAVGVSSVAVAAGDGTAHAAKKGKGCKGKKGKAGKSAATQSKKKGKGCKAKGGKGAGLTDGRYADTKNEVELTLSGNGKTAALNFKVPDFCVLFIYESKPVPVKTTGSGIQASETGTMVLAGIPVNTSWTLNVTKSLNYTLTAAFTGQDSPLGSCGFNGTIKGTLAKG